MKCVQQCLKLGKNHRPTPPFVGEIRRVSDKDAAKMVASDDWQYVPKSAWRALKRKAEK